MTVCCPYDKMLYFIIQFDFKMAGSETVAERCVGLVTSVGRSKNSESHETSFESVMFVDRNKRDGKFLAR